jgi:hypothetical protein
VDPVADDRHRDDEKGRRDARGIGRWDVVAGFVGFIALAFPSEEREELTDAFRGRLVQKGLCRVISNLANCKSLAVHGLLVDVFLQSLKVLLNLLLKIQVL